MKLLDDYFKLQKQIFNHFGYVEDWRRFPIENHTDETWMLFEYSVAYAGVPWEPEMIEKGEQHYKGVIYTYRHLKQHVFRAKDETMVLVDTQTDGNIVLMVFSNANECHDKKLKELYRECW